MIGAGVGQVLSAVQSGFEAFAQNLSTYVPQLFDSWATQEQAEITAYFTGQQTPVYFSYAFTMQPNAFPQISVTMGPGAEEANADSFGMAITKPIPVTDGSGKVTSYQLYQGIAKHDRYDLEIRHPTNQKLLLWLDIICQWALLQQRQSLLQQGFLVQTISASGVQPDPFYSVNGSAPVFLRTVSLTVRHEVGYYTTAQPISGITSTVTPSAPKAPFGG